MNPTETFDRILMVLTRQIGDVLITTPLIREARRRWPAATIDVLGFAGTLGVLVGNPDVNALIEVPKGSGWGQSWPLIKRLWRRYDLAVICEYSDRAHLYGFVAARQRVGQVSHQWRIAWWKRLLLRHAPVLGLRQSHALLEKLRLLEPWAAPDTAVSVVPPGLAALPSLIEQRLTDRYVVMQVPSLVRYKQWPLEHYAAVARWLSDRGIGVVLTGSASAADRSSTATVASAVPSARVIDAGGHLDFNQMAALLVRAAAYVGPDTSITHLAAACATPVIALYGPTDPTLWGPWPQGAPPTQPYKSRADVQRIGRVVVLQGPQPCVPCSQAGCDRHNASRAECLETMAPQRVIDELASVLDLASLPREGIAAAAAAGRSA